jgi:hypothetical protein
MKKFQIFTVTFIFFILIAPFSVFGQFITFEKHIGQSSSDHGYYVQQTNDSGYIITGSTIVPASGRADDVYLVKTNSNGDTIWTKAFGGTSYDGGLSVQQTSDNGFIVVGYLSQLQIIYLLKTDSIGRFMWSKEYNMGYHGSATSVKELPNGQYIVAGFCSDTCGIVMKINSVGDTIWTRKLCTGYQYFSDVEIVNDSEYVVVGRKAMHTVIYKFDINGEMQWEKIDSSSFASVARSVAKTSDNGFIVVGYTSTCEADSCYDIYLSKYSTNGNVEWKKVIGVPNVYEEGMSVEQTVDGGYFIAGTKRTTYNSRVCIIKTDNMGDTLWTRLYGSQADNNYTNAHSAQQTFDGGYIITGTIRYSNPNAGTDVYLLKVNENGLLPVVENQENLPLQFSLSQNYPNPFNPITVISFSLPVTSNATVKVYNILGQEVATLINNKELHVGNHEVEFDASKLSSGLYFYKLTAHQGESSTGEFSQVKRMILLK